MALICFTLDMGFSGSSAVNVLEPAVKDFEYESDTFPFTNESLRFDVGEIWGSSCRCSGKAAPKQLIVRRGMPYRRHQRETMSLLESQILFLRKR